MDTSVFRGRMPALMTPATPTARPRTTSWCARGASQAHDAEAQLRRFQAWWRAWPGKADGAAAGGGVGAAAGTAGGPGR